MRYVADCFVEDNGRILLVKASYRDHWQFPGGHAEDGESPHQTAVREVLEEVGPSINVTRLLVLNTEVDAQGLADTFCFIFLGTYDGQTPIVLQADELAEFAWVPVEEAMTRLPPLMQPVFSHVRRAVEEVRTIYLESGKLLAHS